MVGLTWSNVYTYVHPPERIPGCQFPSLTMSIGKKDHGTETLEKIDVPTLQELPLPVELEQYDRETLTKIERQLVKRLDCCLLPSIVILFLMNILDRYL